MPLTLKTINDELKRLGHDVHLDKGDGYFYFWKGDANNWLDRTINVPKVSSLMLEQWIGEYYRLKKLNGEMLSGKVPKKKAADPKSRSTKPPRSRTSPTLVRSLNLWLHLHASRTARAVRRTGPGISDVEPSLASWPQFLISIDGFGRGLMLEK